MTARPTRHARPPTSTAGYVSMTPPRPTPQSIHRHVQIKAFGVRTTRKGIAAAQGATSAVISNRALRTLVVRPKVAPSLPVGVTG